MSLSSIRFGTFTLIGRDQQKKLNHVLNNLIDMPQASQFLHPVPWKQYQLDDYLSIIKHPMNLLKVQQILKNKTQLYVQEILDHIQLIWDNCKLYNPQGYFYDLAEKMQKAFKKMIKNYLPNVQVLSGNIAQKNLQINTQPQQVIQQTTNIKKPTASQQKELARLSNNISKSVPSNQKTPNYNNSKQAKYEQSVSQQENQAQQSQQPSQIKAPIRQTIQQVPFVQKNRFYQKLKQITQQQLTQIVVMIQQNNFQGFKSLGNGRYQIVMDNIDVETFKKINQKVQEFIENQKISVIQQQGNKKIKI